MQNRTIKKLIVLVLSYTEKKGSETAARSLSIHSYMLTDIFSDENESLIKIIYIVLVKFVRTPQ